MLEMALDTTLLELGWEIREGWVPCGTEWIHLHASLIATFDNWNCFSSVDAILPDGVTIQVSDWFD